jgi:putative nucleotidyltransferase with HDIG domain
MMEKTREDAWALVNEYTENQNLVKHMLAVEAGMRAYARYYDADEDLWGLVGLLHDFDYEKHQTIPAHPVEGARILREHDWPEEVVLAILSHAETGVPRDTKLRQALYATDELTGLIVAVALVRPTRDIRDVDLEAVKKKWGQHRFAAGVNREEIEEGAQALGVDLDDHIQRVLGAMQQIAGELGLDGR